MREIPILSQKLLEQSQSEHDELIFVAVTHPDLEGTIRLVLDGADYLYEGGTWAKSAFELTMLTDGDQPPRAKFRFPNVDRVAINRFRRVAGPARVSFQVVTSAYFDLAVEPRTVKPGLTVEPAYRASALFLTEIAADDVMVEGTLRSWDYRQESWPDRRTTQALTPGVYYR